MQNAREVYKDNPIDIKECWRSEKRYGEEIIYPISGAFVEFLIAYDKEKFLKLNDNQSYENAKMIYNNEIDVLIERFTNKLKE